MHVTRLVRRTLVHARSYTRSCARACTWSDTAYLPAWAGASDSPRRPSTRPLHAMQHALVEKLGETASIPGAAHPPSDPAWRAGAAASQLGVCWPPHRAVHLGQPLGAFPQQCASAERIRTPARAAIGPVRSMHRYRACSAGLHARALAWHHPRGVRCVAVAACGSAAQRHPAVAAGSSASVGKRREPARAWRKQRAPHSLVERQHSACHRGHCGHYTGWRNGRCRGFGF
jgi:hypothetical protein